MVASLNWASSAHAIGADKFSVSLQLVNKVSAKLPSGPKKALADR
jgi:hypothetical protein